MSEYIFDARNAAIGDWGELHIKERYEKIGCKVKRNSYDSIDLTVTKPDGKVFWVEVKTHREYELKTGDIVRKIFKCVCVSKYQIEQFRKYKDNVLLVWIQINSGKILGRRLDYLLETHFVDGEEFPYIKEFSDDKVSYCFPEQLFEEIGHLTGAEYSDLLEIAEKKTNDDPIDGDNDFSF